MAGFGRFDKLTASDPVLQSAVIDRRYRGACW
jgi:hypothetical protein